MNIIADKIEQPKSIVGDRWYFELGTGNFGASFGVSLSRKEVERRLAKQNGPGQLIQINSVWHWQSTPQPQTKRGESE